MKTLKLLLSIPLFLVFSNSLFAGGIETLLLNASCKFKGENQGFIRKDIVSLDLGGSKIYGYGIQGCGGGRHWESHVAFVENGKVVYHGEIPEELYTIDNSATADAWHDGIKRFVIKEMATDCDSKNSTMEENLVVEMERGKSSVIFFSESGEIQFTGSAC